MTCLVFIMAMLLYFVGGMGVIWVVCGLFGWPFSLPTAIGVWFIATLIWGAILNARK